MDLISAWPVIVPAFLGSLVEAAEALTIVLAVALVLCFVAVLARLLLCMHDLG